MKFITDWLDRKSTPFFDALETIIQEKVGHAADLIIRNVNRAAVDILYALRNREEDGVLYWVSPQGCHARRYRLSPGKTVVLSMRSQLPVESGSWVFSTRGGITSVAVGNRAQTLTAAHEGDITRIQDQVPLACDVTVVITVPTDDN